VCRAESPDMRSIVRGTSFIGAAKLSPVTNFDGWHWCSVALKALTERSERHGVQTISEPEIYHGAKFQLRADARTLSGAKGRCIYHYKAVLSEGAKVEEPHFAG